MLLKYNNQKFIYECIDCGKQFDLNETIYLYPNCSKENIDSRPPKGVLIIVYNFFEILQNNFLFKDFNKNNFLEMLPINKIESLPKLKIGNTPLYEFNRLNNKKLPFRLFFKDDSQNPTFSFKDRASAIVSAFAKEKEFKTIVTASKGNAGSSLAGLSIKASEEFDWYNRNTAFNPLTIEGKKNGLI